MGSLLSRVTLLLFFLPLLNACSFEQTKGRVGILVLVPALVVFFVLWLLNRRGGEQSWEEKQFPDSDDDDEREDHHLM